MNFEALKDEKRSVILSSDISGDCDDVGAIVLLHSYAEELGFPILGMCNSTTQRNGTNTLYAINSFFGHGNIPLGEYTRHTLPPLAESSRYTAEIAERFGKGAPTPEASTPFYRRLLSGAEDDGVILITIGFFTDLSELLLSEGDEYSPLSGVELVRKKVHAVVSMACKHPRGREFNIRLAPAEAERVFELLPVDIYLSDHAVGYNIFTGFSPSDKERLKDNPVFESYRLFTEGWHNYCKNRSFDLTAVQFAALGCGEYYEIAARGRLRFYNGENPDDPEARDATEFIPDEDGNVYIMGKVASDEKIAKEIDRRIAQ